MIWIVLVLGIVCFILFLLLGIVAQTGKQKEAEGAGKLGFFCVVVAIICFSLFVVGMVIDNTITEVVTYEKLTNRTELVNIEDDEGKDIYITVNKDGNYNYYDGYKSKTVKSENTLIYEDENCNKPSIVTYKVHKKSVKDKTWSMILYFTDESPVKENEKRYEIHIPMGTVRY